MAPKRKMQGKVIMVTVRAEENLASRASAIAALRRESISDVLRAHLVEYVENNRQLLGVLNDSIDGISNTGDAPLDTGAPNAETIDIPAIKQEIASLEAKYGTTPNAETIAAMKEARAGRGEPITLEELRAECNALH
jgi:hypothetical protein